MERADKDQGNYRFWENPIAGILYVRKKSTTGNLGHHGQLIEWKNIFQSVWQDLAMIRILEKSVSEGHWYWKQGIMKLVCWMSGLPGHWSHPDWWQNLGCQKTDKVPKALINKEWARGRLISDSDKEIRWIRISKEEFLHKNKKAVIFNWK